MILNLLEKEEEALIIIERALAGSRFPFDETHFRNEAKKRIQQGQFFALRLDSPHHRNQSKTNYKISHRNICS